MKIKITDPTTNHPPVTIETQTHEVELEGVYIGVGIETDLGRFGVCERDGGITLMQEGKVVFPPTYKQLREQLGNEILNDPGMEVAYRSNVAMLLHDRFNKADFTDHDTRNEAASMILNLIFRS